MSGDLTVLPDLDPRRGAGAAGAGPRAEEPAGHRRGGPAARAAADLAEADRLKALLTDPARQVSTHRDDASGRVVMRVEDRATGDLVEQIPADALLRLYAALRDTLVDERV